MWRTGAPNQNLLENDDFPSLGTSQTRRATKKSGIQIYIYTISQHFGKDLQFISESRRIFKGGQHFSGW